MQKYHLCVNNLLEDTFGDNIYVNQSMVLLGKNR